MDELRDALAKAIEDQMKHGKTTLIEAMINQELGEPFRRDAMKKPVAVAGSTPRTCGRRPCKPLDGHAFAAISWCEAWRDQKERQTWVLIRSVPGGTSSCR